MTTPLPCPSAKPPVARAMRAHPPSRAVAAWLVALSTVALLHCDAEESETGTSTASDAGVSGGGPGGSGGSPSDASTPPTWVDVGTATSPPAWANEELDAFDAFGELVQTFYDRFVVDADTGELCVSSYGAYNWDDVMEGEAVFDKYLLLHGTDEQRRTYSAIYKYYHGHAIASGWVDEFWVEPYDAEHVGEAVMYLWSAMEVTPGDTTLDGWNQGIADFMMSPAIYDDATRLLRSSVIGTSYIKDGVEAADSLINVLYLTAAARAWLTTGDERYRGWALEYAQSWADAAAANDGILPFQLDPETRAVGPFSDGQWWGTDPASEVAWTSWAANGISSIGRSLHGALIAEQLLSPGHHAMADATMSTFASFNAAAGGGLPPDGYDGASWLRVAGELLPRQYAAAHAVLMSDGSQALVDDYVSRRAELDGDEAFWVDWLAFEYQGGLTEQTPADAFHNKAAAARETTACIDALCSTSGNLPTTGDELRQYAPGLTAFDYVDGAQWGKRNRRDGALSIAPVRYFHEDGTMGLPAGVAALVRRQSAAEVEVWLYNANETETTVQLVGGHYGQHRLVSVAEQDELVDLGSSRVYLVIAPLAEARLTFALDRFALTASATPTAD